jgi:hypothetical protein
MPLNNNGLVTISGRNALTGSYFGYSTSYRTLLVGSTGTNYQTDAVTLAFNVDVSGNAGSSFGGNGTEYIWRNAGSFKTPNAANTEYNSLFSWNSSAQMTFNQNATFSGTITENSSVRYKDNIETVKYGLDKVLQMRGVTYTKKDTGLKELGLIAEELNEILPEVVLKNEEGEPDSVSYGRITAVLIEAIKDFKKEIEELKSNK